MKEKTLRNIIIVVLKILELATLILFCYCMSLLLGRCKESKLLEWFAQIAVLFSLIGGIGFFAVLVLVVIDKNKEWTTKILEKIKPQ